MSDLGLKMSLIRAMPEWEAYTKAFSNALQAYLDATKAFGESYDVDDDDIHNDIMSIISKANKGRHDKLKELKLALYAKEIIRLGSCD